MSRDKYSKAPIPFPCSSHPNRQPRPHHRGVIDRAMGRRRLSKAIPEDIGERGECLGPVDYPCVRRFRHRRLVTYLWLHGFRHTFAGLLKETDAFMSVLHLSRLVEQGAWDDAIAYASRFLQPTSHPQSDEAQVLLHFLRHHKAFARMVAGDRTDRDVRFLDRNYGRYQKHDDSVSNDSLRIRSITISLLHSDKIRNSLDWERVRQKASEIVQDLANEAPELTDLVVLPGSAMMPHDVLPIGFGFRQSRHVKEQDRPRPKTLAKIYLRTQKKMSSSTQHYELNRGLTDKTRKWLVDIIDESLQAGSIRELQSSGKEGVPSALASHTMNGSSTNLTKNSGISSLTNADAPVAPFSQPVSFTSCAKNSLVSSMTNAGTNKHVSPESSSLRKNPRTELTTFDEDPQASMTEVGTGTVLEGVHSA